MIKISSLLVALLLSLNTLGQDLHEEVTKVFNFYPHQMSKEEQQAVYPKLDAFFELVIKDKEKYIEPLRYELEREGNNPYFYFDGGLLLLEISKEKQDIQLVADALAKSDLRDLPSDVYLNHMLRLSLNGANVIDAALHTLDDSTFNVFIPQHVLTLKYGEALKFILPRYSPELYVDRLIEKFSNINSVKNKLTVLDLFVYANSCKADAFLSSLASDNEQPDEIRKAAKNTLKNTSVSGKSNEGKYAKLFEERKEILSRVSDEAIYELDANTIKMRKTYKCN